MIMPKSDRVATRLLRRAKQYAGRSLYLPTEAPHFQMEANGQRYVFCTIHKNASSSIRAMVEAASPHARSPDESIFRFLYLNHLTRFYREFRTASYVIVFVKHPVHRIVSCFQNKFIQRKGHRAIFKDYQRVTGQDPANATFERFVREYVAACFKGEVVDRRCNRHIYTQKQQLLPVAYDVIERVDQFDETMKVLGLSRLLGGRANVTSDTVEMRGAWDQASEVLYNTYCERGQTPNRKSLLDEELATEIKHLYRADFRAFGYLFGEIV